MLQKFLFISILVVIYSSLCYSSENWDLTVESGAVWQNRNDVRITPNSGTYVEFDEFNKGPFFHYRAELSYQLDKRHGFRILYAPFNLKVTGNPGVPISFDGQNFLGNQPIDVDYTFNSYRLSYRYGLFLSPTHRFFAGITGKIRDANIQFSQGNLSKTYKNLGFVPLFYFYYWARIGENWSFQTDLDIAAAPQGRAIDFAFKLRRHLNPLSAIGLGYRTLEGGADNEKVFTFSWFNYLVIDYNYKF